MSKANVVLALAVLAGSALLVTAPWRATAQTPPPPVTGFTVSSGSSNSAWIVSSSGTVTYCTVATGAECTKVGQAQ